MEEPTAGSQIRVNMGLYYHYGIYVGNDMVIQFGLPNNVYQDPNSIEVVESPMNVFLNDGFLEVRKYTKKEMKIKRKDEDIVKYAYSKLGEKGYDILHNNCEHFANECCFSCQVSNTIEEIRKKVRKNLKK